MRPSRASGAALLAGLLLLSGCGDHAKITDAASPQAKACRAAIAARITSAYADAAPGTADATLAMQRALSGTKPEECKNIDDALGARMIAELGSEHDQMLADQTTSASAMPMHH
jgi:hypothetical protein